MKRIKAIIVLAVLSVVLSACGNTSGSVDGVSDQADSSVQPESVIKADETEEEETAQYDDRQDDLASESPLVYFTSDISASGLVKNYEVLGWEPAGNVAVKISTGEPPASNYLRPELIGDLVQMLDGTIVECNTAYGGSRSSAAMHKQVAEDHGFTAIADFDLLDEDGEVEWAVTGGTRLNRAIVGSHAENYTDWVILSHFKGHAMAGFGGAIKNVAIGMSSPSGKVYVHTALLNPQLIIYSAALGAVAHSTVASGRHEYGERGCVYRQYTGREQKGDVVAYQIRQAFKPGEVTAEEANRIGYELAMAITKGKHAFIVATHTDRPHITISCSIPLPWTAGISSGTLSTPGSRCSM